MAHLDTIQTGSFPRPDVRRVTLTVGRVGGLLAMTIPNREPFLSYLLVHATILRQQRATAPAAVEHLEAHAHALDLLAELVRVLPEDDERLLMLGTLAVRDGLFAAGAGTEHALSQFDSTSREACDVFLTNLVRIARDDALTSARAHGHLPPQRPR